eukprot:TRINITY_DN3675_c0_g1_i1.p1 TRINITY_DN3675_c0_g1~~TRINITY_DN3675_c0_g1_i1.p1  ORF type:complete len:525 (-),score=157.67 TRINITY_DN3675_c0_g1_i1:294-1868(-)
MVHSLASFEETDPRAVINSPRSLNACKSEGVLPQELIYKPIEAFQEKNLSPRLVKLRYDFFEAKRRDLLAATRRARDAILADERRDQSSSNMQLEMVAKESGLSKGAVLALNSDGLKLERQKLLRAQESERNWLKNALNAELNQLKALESANNYMVAEGNNNAEKAAENSRRMKEMNDKRAADEERKQMELEARMKLEKQLAKEEFHKQMLENKRKAEIEAQKAKEAYERQCRDAEAKRQAEREKEEKREREARELEARKDEMRAQDQRRLDIMEQKKEAFAQVMGEKKEARDMRIYASIQNNMEIEAKRRADFEQKCRDDQAREERLMQARAIEQEEGAKRSFQTMMKRKVIQEQAARKAEERRSSILDAQEETELRLLEHEQKKERYLDFKRELDGLRNKNKEINVERQRRREEAGREGVADAVRKKDDKIDLLNAERQRMWQLRRAAQSEAYRARELVKSEIMRQRVTSKFDSTKLEKKLEGLMKSDMFSAKILQTSNSMPSLKSSTMGSQRSIQQASPEA